MVRRPEPLCCRVSRVTLGLDEIVEGQSLNLDIGLVDKTVSEKLLGCFLFVVVVVLF